MLNLSLIQVLYYRVFFKKEVENIEYKEAGGNWFVGKHTAGFYIPYLGKITVPEIEKNESMFVEEKKVYYFPHIDFKLSNGEHVRKFFKDKEELEAFIDTPDFQRLAWLDITEH